MNNEPNFQNISRAIEYIVQNSKNQPSLDEIASHVNMSPSHFYRVFQDMTGVTPKKFLQYLNLKSAKQAFQKPSATLFDAAYQTGLSGTGRLHDLFVKIEGMTPGEYKEGGKGLQIYYAFYDTLFGKILIASTTKGVCYIGFDDVRTNVLEELHLHFPNAQYMEAEDENQHRALYVFRSGWDDIKQVKLHLKGTDFQLKVWETLLKIPVGELTSYGSIAKTIGQPNACRAVGSAVGANPVSLLIPCHRVIQSSGVLGQYHWGPDRKSALVAWELAKTIEESF